MSELKLVSPLLDQMSVEEEIAGHNGCTCYALRHVQSGERFVVKRISVPASDLQVRALILSGAYPDDAAVHAYYGTVLPRTSEMSSTPGMTSGRERLFCRRASAYQIEPKESGIGYDVYILYPRMVSLRAFLDRQRHDRPARRESRHRPVRRAARPAAMRAICLQTSSRRTCS